MNAIADGPLIAVLKNAIWREREKIRKAEAEIFNLECQLHDLGVELPLAISAGPEKGA